MNTSMTCELAHLDGAYVLGALSPEERLEFERHLPGCPDCARAVQQLAGLPGLLAQVSADAVDSAPEPGPVPETLLPALVREVRRGQHRRRWVAGLAAAVAVVAIGAGAGAVVAVTGGDDGGAPAVAPTAPAAEMTQVDQDSVLASVSLTAVAWGTRLDLTCSYDATATGYHDTAPPTYSLVVRSQDGDVQQVATWTGLPGRTMRLTGATALTTEEISAVEILAADGDKVLELTG